MASPHKPFVLEIDGPEVSVADAPPVPEAETAPPQTAVAAMMRAPAKPSVARRLFYWAGGLFLSLAVSIATYEFIASTLNRWPVLGFLAMVLAGVATVSLLWMAGREWAALMRLSRIDHLRERSVTARGDLEQARALVKELDGIYAGREELAWNRRRLTEQGGDLFDPDALIRLAEVELLGAADQAARREIEAASRKVATATALVPLALVDVAVALMSNLRMIRRIADIYGGRAGQVGSIRMLKRVFSHLVATGAVAVGDDLISSVAGGGVLSKVSRRFGEGVINGALTARVGIAAMEVCRPLPFEALPRPKVANLLSRALAGLFGVKD